MGSFIKISFGCLVSAVIFSTMGVTSFAENKGLNKITVSKNGEYTDVQKAIDDIADGGTITVEEGVYNGPFEINGKEVRIVGSGDVVFTFDSEYVEGLEDFSEPYAGIVNIKDSKGVSIENIKIKGNVEAASESPVLISNTCYSGIAVVNSNAEINACTIEDITYKEDLQESQNGYGIYAEASEKAELKVKDTNIDDFNKTAIASSAEVSLEIDDCVIDGLGEQENINQSGIEYSGDAVISDSLVKNLRYSLDSEWGGTATAIYNLGEGNTSVIKNVKIRNIDYSLYVEGVSDTVVESGFYGGIVEAYEAESLTIKGGVFKEDVSSYVDEECVSIKDEKGNYVVMTEEEYEDSLNGDDDKDEDKHSDGGYKLEEKTAEDKENVETTEREEQPAEKEIPFIDVAEDDQYYDAIVYVYKNGLMSGISDEVFAPNGMITRGMAAVILWNKEGNPEPNGVSPFLDVTADDYFSKAVAWAYEEGIVSGYDKTTFAPDDYVTVEQFTIMLDIMNGKRPLPYTGNSPYAARGWAAEQISDLKEIE